MKIYIIQLVIIFLCTYLADKFIPLEFHYVYGFVIGSVVQLIGYVSKE